MTGRGATEKRGEQRDAGGETPQVEGGEGMERPRTCRDARGDAPAPSTTSPPDHLPTRALSHLRNALRGLRDDLWTGAVNPLPPSVWLRWFPHGLVFLVAIGTLIANADQMADGYGLGTEYGLLCATAQGVAVALALWCPVPAWWLSMTATIVAAMGARVHLIAGQVPGDPGWPWGPPALVAHGLVLFLLALRVPTRVSATVLALTALATWITQGLIGAAHYSSTGTLAVALFAGVVLLGIALRGRREARTQLVEQAGITAEERARRTLLEERSRIARELHDVVAHHMSVISIQAQVAPHLVENPSEELKENLDGIRKNALEALTELRRVLGVLRSEHPDDPDGPYGLGDAGTGSAPDAPQPTLDRIDALIDNTRAAGLHVVTDIRGEPNLPYSPGVELSAYRIVQEGLSNALRHAPGSHVRVEITHFPEGLYLGVLNSRPERPVQPSPGAGHGLLGMRERATMLGGHLTATRTLHGGFAVSAFLPKDGRPRPDGPRVPAPDPRLPAPELYFPPPGTTDFMSLRSLDPLTPPGEETP
ncbi:histidine kinase [Streptomyces sp. NPDC086077]|uniref:sensor histidine kinase n=1 Tax=Streptomyces sp. NPDC086077 TaxID=3154862 RepID=UPI00341E9D1C